MATRRRQAAAGREWALVSGAGEWRVEEVGKHQVMRRTGLPPRDLRALDPMLSYPSSILGRERAIVVNLEHIKAVITAAEVLVPNPRDPMVAPLVQDLRARLADTPGSSPAPPQPDVEARKTDDGSPAKLGEEGLQKESETLQKMLPDGNKQPSSPSIMKDGQACGSDKILPFEFRVLEVCLESACKSLELETSALEKEAYPALDELTSEVSTLNLERVRQIKSRLVAISGRVQKVRDELEHLLDDDMDMAAMHLSEKLVYQAAGQSSRFDIEKEPSESDEERDEDIAEGSERSHESFIGFRPDIDELEILLEAYFVQIDGTLNKLSTLREYVDDTEDYINIMLDDKQNQLLQMGIMLSTGTLVISCAIAITGLFGINIHISLYEAPGNVFWQTTYGLIGGSIGLYLIALLCYKKSGILQ